jgi:hypothetical protein
VQHTTVEELPDEEQSEEQTVRTDSSSVTTIKGMSRRMTRRVFEREDGTKEVIETTEEASSEPTTETQEAKKVVKRIVRRIIIMPDGQQQVIETTEEDRSGDSSLVDVQASDLSEMTMRASQSVNLGLLGGVRDTLDKGLSMLTSTDVTADEAGQSTTNEITESEVIDLSDSDEDWHDTDGRIIHTTRKTITQTTTSDGPSTIVHVETNGKFYSHDTQLF